MRVSARLLGCPRSRIVGGSIIELAVERRTPDFEPPGDLRHLAAIMRDREPDNFGLHVFEGAYLTVAGQHRETSGPGQRRDRYFVTCHHFRRGGMECRLNDERFAGLIGYSMRRRCLRRSLREIDEAELIALAHHHRAIDGVFELANIAGPAELREP